MIDDRLMLGEKKLISKTGSWDCGGWGVPSSAIITMGTQGSWWHSSVQSRKLRKDDTTIQSEEKPLKTWEENTSGQRRVLFFKEWNSIPHSRRFRISTEHYLVPQILNCAHLHCGQSFLSTPCHMAIAPRNIQRHT